MFFVNEKNITILVLLILFVFESGYILINRNSLHKKEALLSQGKTQKTQPKPNLPKPMLIAKGMKLNNSPIAKFAYKIAPGSLDENTKKVMIGFNMNSKQLSDESIEVLLTPKDSLDQSQQYTIKSGETLYFIEQIPFDDKADIDKDLNYRDDYGVIVDKNGIVL